MTGFQKAQSRRHIVVTNPDIMFRGNSQYFSKPGLLPNITIRKKVTFFVTTPDIHFQERPEKSHQLFPVSNYYEAPSTHSDITWLGGVFSQRRQPICQQSSMNNKREDRERPQAVHRDTNTKKRGDSRALTLKCTRTSMASRNAARSASPCS